jgi:hypothetical protein
VTLTFKTSIYSNDKYQPSKLLTAFPHSLKKYFFFAKFKIFIFFQTIYPSERFFVPARNWPLEEKKWKIIFNIFSCFLMLPTLKANFFDRQKAFFPLIDGKVETNKQKSFILILKKEKLKKFERRKLVLNYTLSLVSSYFFSTFYCQF